MSYHIETNTIQEPLIIPLFGRMICSEHFPDLYQDPEAARICGELDYSFEEKRKKMESVFGLFGALEVAQRHYDLLFEVKNYLNTHPQAAVVNLGCGLDDTFRKADNGMCRGYNIDMPDVIAVRNELLPAGEREENIACDLNDHAWMDRIPAENGAVFFAAGVFYYFRTGEVKAIVQELGRRFPGSVLVFDSCNQRGAKMMTKTWLKEAGISDVKALFSLENETELKSWSPDIRSVTSRSYMRGYRDIYDRVRPLYKLMIRFCDRFVRMRIVRSGFRQSEL